MTHKQYRWIVSFFAFFLSFTAFASEEKETRPYEKSQRLSAPIQKKVEEFCHLVTQQARLSASTSSETLVPEQVASPFLYPLVALPLGSIHLSHLPKAFSPLFPEDFPEEKAARLYKALFKVDLPQDGLLRPLAVGHLLAAFPLGGIYVQEDVRSTLLPLFMESLVAALEGLLEAYGDDVPHRSYLGEKLGHHETVFTQRPYTIVALSTQLESSFTSRALCSFFKSRKDHTLLIGVKRAFSNDSHLPRHYISKKVRNLVLTDPLGLIDSFYGVPLSVVKKDDAYMSSDPDLKIQSLEFRHFPRLRSIYHMDGNYKNLKTVIFTGFRGVKEINSFLKCCKKLKVCEDVFLSAAMTTGHGFMERCDRLETFDMSHFVALERINQRFFAECLNLKALTLAPCQKLKEIEGEFLSGCPNVVSYELSNLPHLKRIATGFLFKCLGMKELSLKNLPVLKEIGPCFVVNSDFYYLKGHYRPVPLRTAHFSGLDALQRVGDGFCAGWSELESFSIGGTPRLKVIGHDFFKGMKAKHFECDGFPALKEVGDDFMAGSSLWRHGQMILFSKIKKIGAGFLEGSESLESFDSLGMEHVKEIPASFLRRCLKLRSFNSRGLVKVVSVHGGFLEKCDTLETCDMLGFTSLKTVGPNFMSDCASIEIFDTQGMNAVQSIECGFLSNGCGSGVKESKLETFNCRGLTSLTAFPDNFLRDSRQLRFFETQGLNALEGVGNNFLYGKKICVFDTTPLIRLKRVGNGFLSSCANLESVNTSGLVALEETGDDFLAHCPKLKSFEGAVMGALRLIRKHFLYDCGQLEFFDSRGFSAVEKIEGGFLWGAASLLRCNLSGFGQVQSIGYGFCSGTKKLEELDGRALVSLRVIGSSFAFGAENLSFFDTSTMPLEEVGAGFMTRCARLKEVKTQGMGNLKKLDHDFLSYCPMLTCLDTTPFTKVRTIGKRFLAESEALTFFKGTPFGELQEIDEQFMESCINVRLFETSGMVKLEKIGPYFLSGAHELEVLDLGQMPALHTLGLAFLNSCPKIKQLNLKGAVMLKKVHPNAALFCDHLCQEDRVILQRLMQ